MLFVDTLNEDTFDPVRFATEINGVLSVEKVANLPKRVFVDTLNEDTFPATTLLPKTVGVDIRPAITLVVDIVEKFRAANVEKLPKVTFARPVLMLDVLMLFAPIELVTTLGLMILPVDIKAFGAEDLMAAENTVPAMMSIV